MSRILAEASPERDPLRDALIHMIRQRDDATPRHLQVELGPSEVGHPCMRKLAYGMMQVPACNPPWDPLPSIIGTAAHTWMESAAEHANKVLAEQDQPQRWITENRVTVANGLAGSCDLYDMWTDTVIDHKFPGPTAFRQYVKDPGIPYRTQVHLYGKGFANMKLPVKKVAIAFIPRSGKLSDMHLFQEDYDPAIADAALKRRNMAILLINDLEVEEHPDRYQLIPATPYDCRLCPWWKPEPTSPLECRGDQ